MESILLASKPFTLSCTRNDERSAGLSVFLREKKILAVVYPDPYIAVRVVLTARVPVASVDASFSKSKPVKSSVRSTMSQE
jgi:hypothetical protein